MIAISFLLQLHEIITVIQIIIIINIHLLILLCDWHYFPETVIAWLTNTIIDTIINT